MLYNILIRAFIPPGKSFPERSIVIMKFRILAVSISLLVLSAVVTGCGRKYVRLQELPVLNYTPPAQGDDIIVMKVKDYGEIKIRLFPELLPEACENFVTLANDGYYDELIFHRVISDFMIQGGDPKGDGTGGESCWGGQFDGGVSSQLIHLPGALAYANAGMTSTDGSQFYIVTGQDVDNAFLDTLTEQNAIYFSQEARELYTQHGGTPVLDGNYTVFGQVIDGLDIVEAISHVETNADDKPKKAVYLESVRTEPYDNGQIRWYPADYEQEP